VKKQTKIAFKSENLKQNDTHMRTKQPPACPM